MTRPDNKPDNAFEFQLDWGTGPFPVSQDGETLRKRIIADPYDDSLREVYAALALMQGNPRGEYVRLGLLAETASRERKRYIDDAMIDLRARYGRAIYAEWFASPFGRSLGRLLAPSRSCERAGFVHHYAFEAREPADVDALAALTPLESVIFPGHPRPLKRTRVRDVAYSHSHPKDLHNPRRIHPSFARSPTPDMPTCEELTLHGRGHDKSLAARISSMQELRALHIHRVDRERFEAIARLPRLEKLTIAYGLPRRAAEIFQKEGSFPALESLTIVECTPDLVALGEFARRGQLRELGVEAIGDLSPFFSALSGAKLETLSLYGIVDMGAPLTCSAFKSLRLDALKTLCLSEYAAQPDVALLAESPALRSLHTLILHGIEITTELMLELATTDFFRGMREFSLNCTNFKNPCAEALSRNAHFQGIERLKLYHTGITEPGARALLEHMPALSAVEFGYCRNFQPLTWFSQLSNLSSLRSLRGVKLGGEASKALEALASSPHAENLRELDLPNLQEASDRAINAFIESPHLTALGHFPVHDELAPNILDRLLRRFGHRVGILAGERRGPLPEPDLDPWWSHAGTPSA